jgi:hypothetical protein
MSLDELTALSEKLKSLGKMSFLPAASDVQVKEFETNNSLTLPSKLREWRLFSDGGEFYRPLVCNYMGWHISQ